MNLLYITARNYDYFSVEDFILSVGAILLLVAVVALTLSIFLDHIHSIRERGRILYQRDFDYFLKNDIKKDCPSIRFWKDNRYAYRIWKYGEYDSELREKISHSITIEGKNAIPFRWGSYSEQKPFMEWIMERDPDELKYWRGFNNRILPSYPGDYISLGTEVTEYKKKIKRRKL